MLASSRSVPVTAVLENFLIDRLQNLFDRQFNYFVFKTADSQWSPLFTARFGNIAPASGLGVITHTLQPVRQALKVLFEILSVLLLGYAVHADGFVSVKRFVAGTQVVQIRHMVIQ